MFGHDGWARCASNVADVSGLFQDWFLFSFPLDLDSAPKYPSYDSHVFLEMRRSTEIESEVGDSHCVFERKVQRDPVRICCWWVGR